jgi:phenylacetate-CoA ligase
MIIGTNFRNYAMPLLRYETGDIAIIKDRSVCRCGRRLPLIKGIAGRKDDIITTPEGAKLPAVNFYSLFREYKSIERFQIIQWDIDNVETRIQSENLSEDEKAEILEQLRLRLGDKIKIKIRLNKEFEKNPQGKRRTVMSKIQELT